jgi:L-ribulokinase
MEQHGAPVNRVINGGGIPQRNEVLNRIYANVLNKPVLVPSGDITSLGSAIFAFLATGAFPSIEAAQQALCPPHRTVEPDPAAAAVYQSLYQHYRKLYFALGDPAGEWGSILPQLRHIARSA